MKQLLRVGCNTTIFPYFWLDFNVTTSCKFNVTRKIKRVREPLFTPKCISRVVLNNSVKPHARGNLKVKGGQADLAQTVNKRR